MSCPDDKITDDALMSMVLKAYLGHQINIIDDGPLEGRHLDDARDGGQTINYVTIGHGPTGERYGMVHDGDGRTLALYQLVGGQLLPISPQRN